jgi:hypothetical protein
VNVCSGKYFGPQPTPDFEIEVSCEFRLWCGYDRSAREAADPLVDSAGAGGGLA